MIAMITEKWYQDSKPNGLLRVMASLYRIAIQLRRKAYQVGLLRCYKLSVPVIVVGNITVGGTGKTPLAIALAAALTDAGVRVGIVSRGYRSQCAHYPHEVKLTDDAQLVGDEPLLLARKTQCPVVIAPNRVQAAKHLLANHQLDVIVSDDGLQHYALKRDIEICVVDGTRRFGNGVCLPAGPLREPVSRLKTVDSIFCNGEPNANEQQLRLIADGVTNLADPNKQCTLADFISTPVHAVAGIGFPQRFFNTLIEANLDVIPHAFPDHHQFSPNDFNFDDGHPIIMTEKDAVKCQHWAKDNYWRYCVKAEISPNYINQLISQLKLN